MKVTIEMVKALKNNDGMTLRGFSLITYKSGWQVATEGIECVSAEEAFEAIKCYGGDCGLWLEDGIYYVDKSHRVNTKREALEVGRACKQISVLCWRTMKLAYC